MNTRFDGKNMFESQVTDAIYQGICQMRKNHAKLSQRKTTEMLQEVPNVSLIARSSVHPLKLRHILEVAHSYTPSGWFVFVFVVALVAVVAVVAKT